MGHKEEWRDVNSHPSLKSSLCPISLGFMSFPIIRNNHKLESSSSQLQKKLLSLKCWYFCLINPHNLFLRNISVWTLFTAVLTLLPALVFDPISFRNHFLTCFTINPSTTSQSLTIPFSFPFSLFLSLPHLPRLPFHITHMVAVSFNLEINVSRINLL